MYQPDKLRLTAAREFTSDGVKRFLVWISQHGATCCHSYEAANAEDAMRQAREELRQFERATSLI